MNRWDFIGSWDGDQIAGKQAFPGLAERRLNRVSRTIRFKERLWMMN